MNSDNTVATFVPNQEVEDYPVTFLVKDDSDNLIEGAKITIEGVSYLTDATGIVSVWLDAKAYNNITVEKAGYTTQSTISVTVADKAILKEIELVEA